ncbi:uncharacterized protein isoform X2 [Choristoneura fumiferana]|uniref:uncharacterized protein isoform X2 n=1 Tax=Choristoneura fumiferana TaxID=7141 RepID=UPI003D1587C5
MADPCPPRIPCPPMPPSPCPQICPPPPPAPPCRVKPVMRGLHWAQTERHIFKAFALAALGGIAFAYLLVMPRRATYREFYAKTEFEDWADDMARKGLFQAVPKGGFPKKDDAK